MNARTKNLLMVGGAVVLVGMVGVNTLMPAAPTAPVDAQAGAAPVSPAPSGEPAPSPASPSPPGGLEDPAATRRSYAVGLHDLAGFPPDAAPGARLELWVTWEPPITEQPRLQKLIGDVVLERTIPGAIPEAPVTILLSVPAEKVSDLIYADTFGKLSVAVPG